jgi:hypothetical protein
MSDQSQASSSSKVPWNSSPVKSSSARKTLLDPENLAQNVSSSSVASDVPFRRQIYSKGAQAQPNRPGHNIVNMPTTSKSSHTFQVVRKSVAVKTAPSSDRGRNAFSASEPLYPQIFRKTARKTVPTASQLERLAESIRCSFVPLGSTDLITRQVLAKTAARKTATPTSSARKVTPSQASRPYTLVTKTATPSVDRHVRWAPGTVGAPGRVNPVNPQRRTLPSSTVARVISIFVTQYVLLNPSLYVLEERRTTTKILSPALNAFQVTILCSTRYVSFLSEIPGAFVNLHGDPPKAAQPVAGHAVRPEIIRPRKAMKAIFPIWLSGEPLQTTGAARKRLRDQTDGAVTSRMTTASVKSSKRNQVTGRSGGEISLRESLVRAHLEPKMRLRVEGESSESDVEVVR